MARGRVFAFVLGLALVIACDLGTSTPSAADSTITWLADSITQGPNDPRQALIDAFENAHPDIRVELINGPSNTDALRDTLRATIAGGSGVPDVYLGDVIWPATFGHDGLALPLNDHLPRDFWRRFPIALVQGATYRGRTYAAPFFTDQGLLYYRKDLLDREHLKVPETWEQLATEAAELQSKGLVTYGFVWQGASYEGLTCVWTEFMTDAGGRALDSAGRRSAIDSPQSLNALRFLRGLVADRVAPQEVIRFEELQVTDAVLNDRTAFARAWPSTYVNLRAKGMLDRVWVAPLPTFAGGLQPGASTAGGWGLSINPHTAHLRAALTFIDWMTDVEAQAIMAGEYHEIPANAQVRADPRIAPESPILQTVRRSTPTARPADTPAYPAVSRAIYSNVNKAIDGTLPPDQALRLAAQQIDQALAGVG